MTILHIGRNACTRGCCTIGKCVYCIKNKNKKTLRLLLWGPVTGSLIFFLINIVWTIIQEQCSLEMHNLPYTVEHRYKAVQYCKILHKLLQELRQNINQMMDPQNTPHTSPWRPSYGCVFCEYLWENWPRYNGTALYMSWLEPQCTVAHCIVDLCCPHCWQCVVDSCRTDRPQYCCQPQHGYPCGLTCGIRGRTDRPHTPGLCHDQPEVLRSRHGTPLAGGAVGSVTVRSLLGL